MRTCQNYISINASVRGFNAVSHAHCPNTLLAMPTLPIPLLYFIFSFIYNAFIKRPCLMTKHWSMALISCEQRICSRSHYTNRLKWVGSNPYFPHYKVIAQTNRQPRPIFLTVSSWSESQPKTGLSASAFCPSCRGPLISFASLSSGSLPRPIYLCRRPLLSPRGPFSPPSETNDLWNNQIRFVAPSKDACLCACYFNGAP